MWTSFATAGLVLAKRDAEPAEGEPNFSLPASSMFLILLILVLVSPLYLFCAYSLKWVFPVLAIVENPSPPSYEAVLNEDEEEDYDGAPAPAGGAGGGEVASGPAAPITASLRRTFYVLRADGGWWGLFRGVALGLVVSLAVALCSVLFSALPFVPAALGGLLGSLALVQVHTAWVHAVISARASPLSRVRFWHDLPAFRRTLEATGLPVCTAWLAKTVAVFLPLLFGSVLGLPTWDVRAPSAVPQLDAHMVWKAVLVALLQLLLVLALVVPATVVLVRVQASLLPPDEHTVVPFDRSFGGSTEPLVVTGRGYTTMRDAYATVTHASWRRLYLLYVKVCLAEIALDTLLAALIAPIIVLTARQE